MNSDSIIDEAQADGAQGDAADWAGQVELEPPTGSAVAQSFADGFFAKQRERERTMMQLQPPPYDTPSEPGWHRTLHGPQHNPTTFPSFYGAVHRAWNAEVAQFSGAIDCIADAERYDPDEHICFALAGLLRVELHAAGIRLSNDGNGSESVGGRWDWSPEEFDVAEEAVRRWREDQAAERRWRELRQNEAMAELLDRWERVPDPDAPPWDEPMTLGERERVEQAAKARLGNRTLADDEEAMRAYGQGVADAWVDGFRSTYGGSVRGPGYTDDAELRAIIAASEQPVMQFDFEHRTDPESWRPDVPKRSWRDSIRRFFGIGGF